MVLILLFSLNPFWMEVFPHYYAFDYTVKIIYRPSSGMLVIHQNGNGHHISVSLHNSASISER